MLAALLTNIIPRNIASGKGDGGGRIALREIPKDQEIPDDEEEILLLISIIGSD